MINAFQSKVGADYQWAERDQVFEVLREEMKRRKGVVREDEIARFWEQYSWNHKLFFRQILMRIAKLATKIPSAISRRSPAEERQLG